MKNWHLLIGVAIGALLFSMIWGCQWSNISDDLHNFSESDLPKDISYNFHVKPILSDRCFVCHGPDADNREAELRLDLPESEIVGEQKSKAIVAGSANKSEIVQRILSDDAAKIMPPPESKLRLSDYDKAILIKWINQGAHYEDHWSFMPESTGIPDEVHPIDYFIDAQIEGRKLERAKQAGKEELIRRASFDLTGLPPSWSEVSRFLEDSKEDAYERLLDTLLEKTAYGERMASDWLDVARYADSDGYLDDKHRAFYPWRDWVIKAFNDNMPYDQFATWQLAGDLLPDATQESIVATAFNRLHRKNSEAGIVFEEYRVEYVADRLHTFSKAFLGLTVECARCHDHKYDPISQKEYYQLFAFFNQTDEIGTAIYGPGQTPGPSKLLTNEEQDKIIKYLETEIEKHEGKLNHAFSGYESPAITEKEIEASHRNKLVAHHDFEKVKNNRIPNLAGTKPGTLQGSGIRDGLQGKSFFVSGYNSIKLGEKIGWYDRTDPFSVSLWIKPAEKYAEAGIFTHCEDLRLGYKGYSMHLQKNRLHFILAYSWPYNSIEVISNDALTPGQWSHIAVTYDGSSHAHGVKLYINGHQQEIETINDRLYKSILYEPDIHTYGFHGFRLGYRDKIKNLEGGGLDEIKVFNAELSSLEVAYDHQLIGSSKFNLKDFSEKELRAHWQVSIPTRTDANSIRLRRLRDSLNQVITPIPEIMVMGDRKNKRATYLLDRGVYSNPTEEVTAQTPSSLSPAFTGYDQNRLGLSEWLFDDENTLTARVMVNRIWQQHFGSGLVDTPEDFGAQGSLPTHPELLDYLATYFRESNWDIKNLHKHIMTSNAYRRTNRAKPDDADKDPENRFLARGPRQRLSAEMVRDNALAVSGLLVDKVGGPSVYPYQPDGLWDEISNKKWRYPYLQEAGEGLYRRSLYTIWKRTSPPPAMLIFDSPDRSFCTVHREQTNTPLQALNLLNDEHYIEAARNLAINLQNASSTPKEQLRQLARLVWNREPIAEELDQLSLFYQQELELVKSNKINEEKYLSTGTIDHSQEIQEGTTFALAQTAHSLLNSFEAQVK